MAAGTKCCAVQPFFLPKKPYALEGKVQRNNITKSWNKNEESIHSSASGNRRGVTRNFIRINDLRNKILSFRDFLDMAPCTGSVSLKELLVLTLKDLNKSYPHIKPTIPISELKSALPISQILTCFCAFFKSMGDSWTDNAGWRAKYNHTVFYKPDQYDMEKLAVALLDDMFKLAKERILETMEEEEEEKNVKDNSSPFGRVLSEESLSESSKTSQSTSPRTPTSVLPVMKYESSSSSSSSKKHSSTSSLLFPLRVKAVEKLNPIDLKRLSYHIVPQNPIKKDDDEIRNDTMDTKANRKSEFDGVQTTPKVFKLRSNASESCFKGSEFDVVQPPLKLPRLRSGRMDLANLVLEESPSNSLAEVSVLTGIRGSNVIVKEPTEVSALTGIRGSNVTVQEQVEVSALTGKRGSKTGKEPVVTVKEPVGNSKTTSSLPLTHLFSKNNSVFETEARPPSMEPISSTPPPPIKSGIIVTTPPSPPMITTKTFAFPPPPPPPPIKPGLITTTSLAPLPPPPTPLVRTYITPPPPPKSSTIGVGAPQPPPRLMGGGPPPSPPGACNIGVGAPPPPPMLMGGGPPPPPPGPGGAKNLRPNKNWTKLRRSAQMGTLYRFLKGKVEGNSLEGKSSKKGKIGAAAASGKQGMADALAEITRRSAYFQQIEEDVRIHAKTITELKVTIGSFETSDMAELLKFQIYVESHLEKLTDETQVLARFEDFPTKKLEALRMAAALFSKLDNIATTLKNWHIEPPVNQQLVKVENYFNKIKEELDALERTKDEESKKFHGQKINFDFSILNRIKELLVDISSSCMELSLKERREANEKEQAIQSKVSGKILWKAFQFAYRIYTFAGGQDDRADTLTRELAHEIEIDPNN